MRRFFSLLFMTGTLYASPAHAVMEDYPSVKLQGLDKSVGRTITFEATVGSTIQYGPLFIKIHACRKAPPIEKPESAAFLQIWEVPPGAQKSEWVFSGWMFASSPALSAMDHPVYDVWVLDCLGKEEPNLEAQQAETKEEANQGDLPAPDAAAEIPADSEAEPEPQAEEVIDSEAEPEEPAAASAPAPAMETAPQPDPDTAYPSYDPNAAAAPAPAPVSRGETAYDFMNKPAGQPVPQQNQQVIDPDAPYGYSR